MKFPVLNAVSTLFLGAGAILPIPPSAQSASIAAPTPAIQQICHLQDIQIQQNSQNIDPMYFAGVNWLSSSDDHSGATCKPLEADLA